MPRYPHRRQTDPIAILNVSRDIQELPIGLAMEDGIGFFGSAGSICHRISQRQTLPSCLQSPARLCLQEAPRRSGSIWPAACRSSERGRWGHGAATHSLRRDSRARSDRTAFSGRGAAGIVASGGLPADGRAVLCLEAVRGERYWALYRTLPTRDEA